MRTLVLWLPDWPVAAGLRAGGLPGHIPAAVFHANRVVACNGGARDHGVRRGMRRRDAQSRCPDLQLLDATPDRDAVAFEEVLGVLEELRPGVAPLRPGLVALRSPGRFYGGDEEACAVLLEAVVGLGVRDVRLGVADDLFTAEQAARVAGVQEARIIPEGGTADFLRPLPVDVIDTVSYGAGGGSETVSLLQRLGLMTLGDLAGVPAAGVLARFGQQAAWIHRVLTGGGESAGLPMRSVPPELSVEVGFEPPLSDAEAICFSSRRTCEEFVTRLAHHQLVCTDVRIEVEAESSGSSYGGELASTRRWLHPRWFGATDLVDRLHWQLVGSLRAGSIGSPVTRVRLVPEAVVSDAVHADGLWGGTDARVERGVARVQGLLGPEAVVAPVLQGGRTPAERQAMVPWGTRPTGLRPRELPWPGSIPAPYPSRVLPEPVPAGVMDSGGRPVVIGSRGSVSSDPSRFRPHAGEGWLPVTAWAGPWPVDDCWWEPGSRKVARFQLVSADGRAWLVTCDGDRWVTEAAYD
ncbi:DNA polymerase Y family protein [Nocardioides sp. Kera G14]|uniref:DNA polymerase Y family protein n=1 Tax=Nocardioides sp. Kera G14 TaxID=2884264 RepID=UPI001D11CB12|nr:DNA polymerase Y family protein [Nocardioides sp. Kera G14]UDY24824.1 DNA polymerase Y family protein [Nocardioides sp. Kera G14]